VAILADGEITTRSFVCVGVIGMNFHCFYDTDNEEYTYLVSRQIQVTDFNNSPSKQKYTIYVT